tara:strand:- start:875 stop:1033 length:159 start_codon:yes stop_codon:yes gene_type:complete
MIKPSGIILDASGPELVDIKLAMVQRYMKSFSQNYQRQCSWRGKRYEKVLSL